MNAAEHPKRSGVRIIHSNTNAASNSAPAKEHIEQLLRAKLDELELRYKRKRTPETSQAFVRILKLFSDLVLHNGLPSDEDLEWTRHV